VVNTRLRVYQRAEVNTIAVTKVDISDVEMGARRGGGTFL
jgi:hypothetical protein